MTQRPISDPVLKTRYCNDCRAVIIGVTERGLTTWLDATPITRAMEAIYHAGGRNTFQVQPKPGRTAWVDWRSPASSRPVTKGIVLVEHPHRSPGGGKAPDPPWLLDDFRISEAPPTDVLF